MNNLLELADMIEDGCDSGGILLSEAEAVDVVAALRTAAPVTRTPADELGPSELIRIELRQTMLDCWNSICSDTDCHPLDIKRQGKKLYFSPAHWADMISTHLASRLSHHASMRDLVSSGGLPEAQAVTRTPDAVREALDVAIRYIDLLRLDASVDLDGDGKSELRAFSRHFDDAVAVLSAPAAHKR